ncbi:MAG: hypothetical protein ACRDWD_12070 [Acidimicrobiia bacterium]
MGFLDLLREAGFRAGLVAGLLTTIGVVAAALGHRFRSPLPLAGIAASAAALLGLRWALVVPHELLIGLVALAAGGLLAGILSSNLLVRSLTAVPGAVLTADAIGFTEIEWLRIFAVVAVVVGAALVADFDRHRAQSGLGPVLMAMTALGVYATVPDTEHALVLVGAFLPVALLGWPRAVASLGPPGSYACVGIVVWTAAVDGRGRLGSVIGATACLGIMALEPLLRRVRPLRVAARGGFPSRSWFLLAGAHVVLVVLCSRVAGFEASPLAAALIAGGAFAVVGFALTFETTGSRRQP